MRIHAMRPRRYNLLYGLQASDDEELHVPAQCMHVCNGMQAGRQAGRREMARAV